MELVEGLTLRRWVERRHPSWDALLPMLEGVGRGLQAAHEHGVVHGDLKPDNILVSHDGRPQLTDFGLSSIAAGRHASRRIAGTPAYMAPEQRRGTPADARSDQYALCVSIWELLQGNRPRPADVASLTAARAALPHRPEGVVAALLRGLSDDPAQRHRDIATVMRALRPVPRRWGLVALAATSVTAVALSIAPRNAPSCTTPPSPSVDWAQVETRLVTRDGPRGHLLVNDVRTGLEQSHAALDAARAELCAVVDPRSLSTSGLHLFEQCLASVEVQHAAAARLLDEGTLDVASDFHRQSTAAAQCANLPRIPGATPLDVDRLRERGWIEDFATMRVLGAVSNPRAHPIAQSLLDTSDDPRLRAAAYIAGAYGLYASDPAESHRWFVRAEQTAAALGDPLLRLDASLGVLSTEQVLGDPSFAAGLAQARQLLQALPPSRQRDVLAARIEIHAMVSAIADGRAADARDQMQALRDLEVGDPHIEGLAFETEALAAQLDGDLETAIERQRALIAWLETRGITPSARLVASLVELSTLTRTRGEMDATLSTLERAEGIAADATVPPPVVRGYVLQYASVLAELGETDRAERMLSAYDPLDAGLAKARLDDLRFAGRSADAVAEPQLRTVLEGSPFVFSIPLAVALAQAFMQAEQPAAAYEVLAPRVRWFAQHYPRLADTLEARLVLGWALHDLGRFDEAAAQFNAVRVAPPNRWMSAWATVGSASSALGLGQSVDASALAEARATLTDAPAGWDFERRRAAAIEAAVQSSR